MPPRAWELICWFHGTAGDDCEVLGRPHPPLLVGYHYAQLTMEEYAASVEDEVAFRMELNAEARSSGRKPGELPDDVIPDDDDLGVG